MKNQFMKDCLKCLQILIRNKKNNPVLTKIRKIHLLQVSKVNQNLQLEKIKYRIFYIKMHREEIFNKSKMKNLKTVKKVIIRDLFLKKLKQFLFRNLPKNLFG